MTIRAATAATVALILGCAAQAAAADLERELLDAAKSGASAAVRALVERGADVNASEPDGTTALHWAAHYNDTATVQLLLDRGARADAANRYGMRPLFLAATNGDAGVIERLLAAKANPNAALPEGQTVLMTAARTGDAESLRVLLRAGADPNAQESWLGETALMWASGENHPDAVTALIAGGANVNARSSNQNIPDWWLKPPALAFLPIEFPKGGWSALMYAARQGGVETSRRLAEAGADLNQAGPDGITPLLLAIINAHFDVAALLLERGADPNLADDSGMAALYAAVDMHTMPTVLARPEAKPSGALDHVEMVELLLARGASVNAQLKAPLLIRQNLEGDRGLGAGSTPLMRAAKAGDLVLMRLLLEHGADLALTQRNGSTTLMLAAGLGWRFSGNSTPYGDRGSESDAVEAIRICLARGADISARNSNGDTALHTAVAGRGSEAIVRLLLEKGADPQARNAKKQTPLDIALAARRDGRDLTRVAALLRQAGGGDGEPGAPSR
jgi:ankyrin repeat protein